ncbi:hypothetical protein DEU31_1768 [Brachybacterium sp. AG952]|uniref:hypothetical protein n=1 Tax=Brachybacterium sp. AG952 TaxID=2183989 RepID=UPI00106134E5|nr:hypothetical protein [Brachybacterium sp. AG952]TDP78317.1 hypothetical protein DEU31_1768 [Brachybacterium sp. AG952]
MSEETPDMRHLSEEDWLEFWRETLSALELTRAALLDSEVNLTDTQAAKLEGHAEMLRQILESRGVDLEG